MFLNSPADQEILARAKASAQESQAIGVDIPNRHGRPRTWLRRLILPFRKKANIAATPINAGGDIQRLKSLASHPPTDH